MLHVRRIVASGLVVPAGAILVALTLTHALAQPASRPLESLRPGFDENEEPQRRQTRRPALRRPDTRPLGTLPGLTDAQSNELPRFGNPPGSGAGNSGFMSTNRRRPPSRRDARKQAIPGATAAAPLSLGAPGASATTQRASAAGTTGRSATAAGATATGAASASPANATPAQTPPRNSLVRIPDGTAGGGIAGTVNTRQLSTATAALLRRRTAAEEDPFAQLGGHAGTFLVLPAIESTSGFDTNPARTPDGRGSSFVTVSPELIARSDWQRHEMTATLRGSYTAYDKTPELDRPSFDGKVTGRVDITRDQRFDLEGRLILGTDNPGSPNVQAGLSRYPVYATFGSTLGVDQSFNRLQLSAGAAVDRTIYQYSQLTDGTSTSNDDRNYNQYGGLGRISYDLMPGLKPFGEIEGNVRSHDLLVDRSGYQRNSSGGNVRAGTSFELSRLLTGEVAVGWAARTYEDPRLLPLQGLLTSASLVWAATPLTTAKFFATTSIDETTVPGVSGVLTHTYTAELDHDFRRWLTAIGKFTWGSQQYQGDDRFDRFYSLSGDLIYKMSRTLWVKGTLRRDWLNSSIPGNSTASTVMMLGVRLQH
jgi:hypothetical protein